MSEKPTPEAVVPSPEKTLVAELSESVSGMLDAQGVKPQTLDDGSQLRLDRNNQGGEFEDGFSEITSPDGTKNYRFTDIGTVETENGPDRAIRTWGWTDSSEHVDLTTRRIVGEQDSRPITKDELRVAKDNLERLAKREMPDRFKFIKHFKERKLLRRTISTHFEGPTTADARKMARRINRKQITNRNRKD